MTGLRKTYRAAAEAEERGVRVVLPRRPRNTPAAVVFGLVALLFLGFSGAAIASTLLAERPEASLLDRLGSVLFTLPFMLGGLGTLVGALAAWNHRCTVELTPDELRVVDHVGSLRWTRSRSARDLRSIEVRERPEARRSGNGRRWQLEARFEGAAPFSFATGYPRAKLEDLASHLRDAALEWGEEVDERAPSPFVESDAPPPAEADLVATGGDALRPGSDLRVHRTADGLVVVVPPSGLRRGSHGLFLMGLLFTTFVSLLGGVLLLSKAGEQEWRDVVIGGFVCSALFAVGATLMAFGWNLGRRSARLTVDGNGLTVERRSPFGDKLHRFAREAVEDVRAGPSGLTVNDVPVLEVQVFVRGEKALGLLSQRSDDEVRALAARLRDALRD